MMIETNQMLQGLRSRSAQTEQRVALTRRTEPVRIANQPGQVEFSDVLAEAVDGIRGAYMEAGEAQREALLGQGSPHKAMIAGAKAGVAFRFMVQTRHKMVEAYREMMSLQI